VDVDHTGLFVAQELVYDGDRDNSRRSRVAGRHSAFSCAACNLSRAAMVCRFLHPMVNLWIIAVLILSSCSSAARGDVLDGDHCTSADGAPAEQLSRPVRILVGAQGMTRLIQTRSCSWTRCSSRCRAPRLEADCYWGLELLQAVLTSCRRSRPRYRCSAERSGIRSRPSASITQTPSWHAHPSRVLANPQLRHEDDEIIERYSISLRKRTSRFALVSCRFTSIRCRSAPMTSRVLLRLEETSCRTGAARE